mmetsp:Transcript_5873/g.9687  ORF Transcript_5873/g.9687 Transcript_5873/m.9687 type:complete len:655 (+) Transcript_5873:171-2135(+)
MLGISMRSYTTALLCCTVFFLFADQNALAPNLSAIADEFGMSEKERDEKLGGYIAFGFFIVGGPVALLVGYFTDTVNRAVLFALVVAFGESSCFATYWVRTYQQLFFCRVLTGISVGGATPIIFSMIGDLYPGESRVYASTCVGVSFSAGVACGQLMSGLIGPIYGWRTPFLIVSIPALCCAAIVLFTVKEPQRGHQEQAVRTLRESKTSYQRLESPPPLDPSPSSSPGRTAATGTGRYAVTTGSSNAVDDDAYMNQRVALVEAEGKNEYSDSSTMPTGLHMHAPMQVSGGRNRGGAGPDGAGEYSAVPLSREDADRVDTTDICTKSINSNDQDRPRLSGINNPAYFSASSSPTSDGDENEIDREDAVEYSEKIDCNKVAKLFQTSSVVIIFIQGLPGCLPWGMIYVFLNDYFSHDRGLSISGATAALTSFGLGGLVGQFAGGWLGQRLYNLDPRLQCVMMGSTTIASVLPMLYLLNTSSVGSAAFYLMALFAGFLVNMNAPNIRVVLQNVCIPEIRGTAFAFFCLTDDIGKGLGPAIVVLFIDMCHGNRREAFNIVVLFWALCGTLLLLLTQTVRYDEAIVQQSVKQAMVQQLDQQQQQYDMELQYSPKATGQESNNSSRGSSSSSSNSYGNGDSQISSHMSHNHHRNNISNP